MCVFQYNHCNVTFCGYPCNFTLKPPGPLKPVT